MHTSASGVSKHLRLLEQEVGVPLLLRKSTRISGISEAGLAALPVIRRILKDVDVVRRITQETKGDLRGQLTIASTHNHARYALVPAIKRFVRRYPQVELRLRPATPIQLSEWVASGEVDLGIGTVPAGSNVSLVRIPCYRLKHCVVTPRGHALTGSRRLTLADISRYPLILNYPESRVGRMVEEVFSSNGVEFTVAIRAMDSSVIKKYVEEGLGIAVLPDFTVSMESDSKLKVMPAGHLFPPSTTSVIMARAQTLPDYGIEFIRLLTKRAEHSRKQQ